MAAVNTPQHEPTIPEEAGRLYRLIAETIPHVVWTARADGWVDFVNQRCLEYTGLEFDRHQGWNWKQVIHPEDLERVIASWTRALQSGERHDIEFRMRRADGAYRWQRSSAVPLRDDGKRILRWFSSITDIEHEVRSAQILEDALRESNERFRTFLEHSPAVAWSKDSALRYDFISGPYEKNVGKPAALMIGRDDFQIWPAPIAQRFRDNDRGVLERAATIQAVEQAPGPDGSERHFLVVKFPLPDASGAMGVAGMGIDITERIQAESLARGYAADVRRLMNRLVATQESERRRVAGELHDLIGQNLTALGIDLTTLKQKLVSSGATADSRIDAMRATVEQTIDAIRGVMTDLRPPALEEFGLTPALRGYAAEFSERTGIKASFSFSGRDTRLPAETELALFRIVQEALTNVAKHSGGSAAHVAVAEEAGGVRLSIEDDGRGFVDPVGARSARRGGWGLPAMRERAEAHGGALRIEFPGRGTRLVIEIPAAQEPSHGD
jgi:PAS domain S-box-containing protein